MEFLRKSAKFSLVLWTLSPCRKLKHMGKEQIVAVLQIGGEFTTDADGHMSYSGGEAHAMFVQSDWTFSAFKQEISSTLNNLKLDQFTFKYFLPKNDKTLISISNDKDLRRMVEFHAESETTYIYVMKKADNRYFPTFTNFL
jgi:hypothetical protein